MGRFISLAVHIAFVLLMIALSVPPLQRPDHKTTPQPKPIIFRIARLPRGDTGSGGNQSRLPPSKGTLPRFSPRPFVLPASTPHQVPALVIEPTLPGPEDISIPNVQLGQYGDPFGQPGAFSLGPGRRGIGAGQEGYGDKPGSGISGGSEIPDGPVTGPEVLYKTDPEFSDEARKAKLQGTVVLEAQIGSDGRVHNVRVRNGLGLGLDERALEAVKHWRFRPAMRRGKPVVVAAVIEINFRLL